MQPNQLVTHSLSLPSLKIANYVFKCLEADGLGSECLLHAAPSLLSVPAVILIDPNEGVVDCTL